MHLFLSPHLDDVALSCGGLIHQLATHGQTVTVRTIMAGDPVVVPDTPLIRDLHRRWAAGDNPMKIRREEDECAWRQFGVSVEHLPLPDCPYRMNTAGEALYPVNESLFGAVHPDDLVTRRQLAQTGLAC